MGAEEKRRSAKASRIVPQSENFARGLAFAAGIKAFGNHAA
jgi:hypothetical protein